MNLATPSRTPALSRSRMTLFALVLLAPAWLAACVQAQPPTDTASPTAPSASTTTGTTTPPATGALAYVPDLKPIFDSDCVPCHSDFAPSAGYSMSGYTQVMRAVIAGSAASRLVVTTQSGGSMYRYFTGDRAGKAALVRSWVVDSKAAQTR